MKSLLCIIFVSFSLANAIGQGFEFTGGVNSNRFFDPQKNKGNFKASYQAGYGYAAGLTIEDLKRDMNDE